MHFNWLLFLSVVAAAYSAVIPQGDIPVKVIYEKEEAHRVYVRNLDKTEQDEVKQEIQAENIVKPEEIKDTASSEVYSNALKNHDEKLQLSPEELPDALRHLPKDPEEITNEAEDTPKETEENNSLKIVIPDEVPVAPVQPQQSSEEDTFFDRIQEIINNGVTRIKEDVKQTQEVVEPEVWTSFNDGVSDFLKNVKDRYSLRQASNGSIFDQWTSFTNNFLSGFGGQNQKPQDGAQQPSFPQNVVSAFQNGVSQITNSFSTLGQNPATVLGDNASATPSSNPIQGFVSQIQTGFTNLLNPSQNPADENSNNPFQNIQNSITTTLGNVFNRPGSAAGDESSGQGGPFQVIQTAIQNLNPFQGTTAKPADTSSSSPIPTKPTGGANPIQSAIQQVTGGNNPIPSIPGLSNTNPLEGVANQISSAVGGSNNIPSIPNIPGSLSGGNPIEGIANQISSAVGGSNNIPSIPNIPGSLSGGNPIEGISNQISSAVGGSNNIPSIPNIPGSLNGGNPIEGLANQITSVVSSNPLPTGGNPIQGVAQQVASAVGANIPGS